MTSRCVTAIALAAAIAAGCGKEAANQEANEQSPPAAKQETPPPAAREEPPPAPAEKRPPAKPSGVATDGEADLTFTGAIETKVTGAVVTCGYTQLGNKPPQGGSWQIRTDDFEFAIVASTDDELDDPMVVLNRTKPERTSFVRKKKAGSVKTARDRTLAEIDEDLQAVVGKVTVHVKGTMKCPALAR